MIKNIRPKSDKLSIKIVYHCILQVHSTSGRMFSFLVTAPTIFICCKERLITRVLSFMCLHNMYITKVATKIEIITATNRKTSVVKLLKKEFLLRMRWPVFVYCITGTWVRYGSHMRIRYGTDLIIFLLISLSIKVCDLYFNSHILLCLCITLILILYIISINCVYVREHYGYTLTANKSLLWLLL